jgi:peroxiredoxin
LGIEVGKPLAKELLAIEVKDLAGETCALQELVGEDQASTKPVLIVFVRQFACAGCSERMAELLIHADILQGSGVDVIVVGSGTVAHAKEMASRFALDSRPNIHVVTDPSLNIHRAFGLHRSYWGVLGAKGTWNLVRAMANGHKNAWGHGDFFQLGGTILLDADKRVALHHEERHLGETHPFGEVVEKTLAMMVNAAAGSASSAVV